MNLTTLGIDLAKTSFSLVGMDQHGKVVLRKTLKRAQLLSFAAPFRKGGKDDNKDAEAICERLADQPFGLYRSKLPSNKHNSVCIACVRDWSASVTIIRIYNVPLLRRVDTR